MLYKANTSIEVANPIVNSRFQLIYNKKNIKPVKRAYIKSDVKNGKITTVYNRNGLKSWLAAANNTKIKQSY